MIIMVRREQFSEMLLFFGAHARWYGTSLSALAMEAQACKDGMIFAQSQGVTHLMLETDYGMTYKLNAQKLQGFSRSLNLLVLYLLPL